MKARELKNGANIITEFNEQETVWTVVRQDNSEVHLTNDFGGNMSLPLETEIVEKFSLKVRQ